MTLFNVHTLAGMRVANGVLAPHSLLRSSAPFRGGNNVDPLLAVRVHGIVDLRDHAEAAVSEPWDRSRFDVREVPVFADQLNAVAWEGLPDLYRIMTIGFGAQLARAVDTVAELAAHGAVLIHCTAGKDRTGVVTALILALLGADRATIEADYTCSTGMLGADYLAALLGGGEIPGEAAHRACVAPLPALHAAHDVVAAHGGTLAYLLAHGLDRNTPALLRERLVVDAGTAEAAPR